MSLSIIVCVTSGEMIAELRQNVASTIGKDVEYEIIEIRNVENPRPISRVYNEGASKARYPYLLFLHQDAGFESEGWWGQIEPKMSEPDCGVIGFAGTKVMFDVPSGWGVHGFEWLVLNLNQSGRKVVLNSDREKKFEEVVALDGFAMFVRKDVWEKYPFDERNIRGFHCYDIDFSLCVGAEYKNYVCTCVLPYHHSEGKFGDEWFAATLDMYDRKWHRILPRYSSDVTIMSDDAAKLAERAWFRMAKCMFDIGTYDKNLLSLSRKYPLTYRSFEHRMKLWLYKLKYGKGKKKQD